MPRSRTYALFSSLAVAVVLMGVVFALTSKEKWWHASPVWKHLVGTNEGSHDADAEHLDAPHEHRDVAHEGHGSDEHQHPGQEYGGPSKASHGHDEHAGHEHDGHDAHGHDDKADANRLHLSFQAQCNIGITQEYLKPIQIGSYQRSITVPGVVAERVGRTRIEVSTPMSGVVTHVHATQGEAVVSGSLLFQLRITAEELVSSQTEFLRTVGELDVENRELTRLSQVSDTGAIPQKTVLERQYAKEKLQAQLSAQREALRLHGLSERQIDDIQQHRRLLRELQIMAPSRDDHSDEELRLSRVSGLAYHHVAYRADGAEGTNSSPPVTTEVRREADLPEVESDEAPLVLQEVRVHKGQTVAAGETLAVLADYAELFVEGQAFDQDVEMIASSARQGWKATALLDCGRGVVQLVEGLDFVYAANEVNTESRALPFFVRLRNEIVRDATTEDHQRFVEWKYRPGRRLQLRVPVEEWENQIVVPVDAIARDGAETFVFRYTDSEFERVSVHLSFRDQLHAVIANDGSLRAGDIIAFRGAHQLQMAFKNRSGGGVDPHAGHTH